MPIPLGVLAVAGAGGGNGLVSTFALLQTVSVSSPVNNVTFNNVNTYSAYKHLQIRYEAQFSTGNNSRTLIMRLNGDNGANYAWHYLQGEGSGTPQTFRYTSTSSIGIAEVTAQGYTSQFSSGIVDILEHASANTNTTTKSLWGIQDDTNPYRRVALYSGLWNNTAAITSIAITADNGANFAVGSRVSLYGIN